MSDNLLSDIKDGISQSERLLDALVPEYFQIEAREIPDFLNFIAGFAEQVNYYNFSNEPEGNWQDFFRSQETLLIIIISRFDLSKQFAQYNKYIAAVNTCEDENLPVLLKMVFDCVFEILENFLSLKTQFNKSQQAEDVKELLLLVKDLDFEIARLKRYNREAVSLLGNDLLAGENLTVAIQDNSTDSIFEGADITEKIVNALPHISELFDYTRTKYNHLVSAARIYLQKNNLLEKEYAPHISLLIAFLNLYQNHLRTSINGLTRRHLDLYYKKLLGIASSRARPDCVHVLFEPEGGINSLPVTTEETLIALKPGRKEPVFYTLEDTLQVTKAKIQELKTVFVSNYTQIIAKDPEKDNINEAQVYQNDNLLFDPVAWQKKRLEISSWPVLGEDQHNLSGNLRTMDDSDIGLIMASPLFYQHEGERTVKIKLHFKAESFTDFKDYVKNYCGVAGKTEESVLHQLLSNAFVLSYSSTEGWEDITSYVIKADKEITTEHYFSIEFKLLPGAKPMDLYNPLIHGQNYESKFPVVKIRVNNYAPHNPYSFFRDTLIERVTITVNVKNFSNVKLHNNISMLSVANPFQPFGPQPSVGSFLDIKNTNVFNRYTTDFCVNIEWLDLPREEGGFDTYYEAYQGPITNNSFNVGLSAIAGSQFKPAPASQQQYPLFNTDARNTLLNKTEFDRVNFKKIEFLNEPGLAAEDETPDVYFKEGVIRFELLSPSEGFGHKQFTKLFPETVMNNAKFFKKKLPLPNQPYIPVIKTISVDYTLEHSENFKDASNESQNNLVLIHQYPFGYHTVYPHNSRKNYYLMPQFDDESNLYIGLKDVEANQEVSILFQLEEKNFHHTSHEPDVIRWSYLANNIWYDLGALSVLNDATNNFVNTGIIRLKLPEDVATTNTILNPDLFWLRASVSQSSGTQSKVIAMCVNAALAVRVSDKTIESELDFNLPAGCITGFTRTVKGIQNVRQLFSSFDGRPHETQEKYYVRVSERLRHKYRLMQARDVMQIILDEFPQLLMVKCFGTGVHDAPILPGVNMQVVLIPKEMEDGRFLSDQPKVNLATLYRVKTFLSKLISPFVNLEVGNPVYEKVKVICSVMFIDTKNTDHGFYIKKLTEDINRNIAPWLYESNSEIKIGTKLFKSDLFMFIKNLPYVTYISGFSAVHFFKAHKKDSSTYDAEINDTALDRKLDYISGSSASAVLIPSSHHLITVLDKTGYHPPAPTGISGFTIGEELLVTAKYDIENEPVTELPEKKEEPETFTLIIPHL